MALDIFQINNNGDYLRVVKVLFNVHLAIFIPMERNKYPSLEIIREYLEADYVYSLEELPGLKKDLELLRKQHLDNDEYLRLLDSMINLVEDSISKGFLIETISD